jgi:flagellar biosynthesis protein
MIDEEKKAKKAVALKFNPERDSAPSVAAKGRGYIAEKILETAKEHDIPIKDDPDLIEILYKLELEQEIPPQIYVVVAEILAFVYKINKKKIVSSE